MEREIKIFLVQKGGFYYGKVVYIRKCLPFSNTRRGIGMEWDSQKIHKESQKNTQIYTHTTHNLITAHTDTLKPTYTDWLYNYLSIHI